VHGHLIVANHLDGRILKGTSLDVDSKRPACHLKTATGETHEVVLAEVKALFFVKTVTGRPEYNDAKLEAPGDSRLVGTRRVKVHFGDGEEIVGLMNRFPPITPYFYMLPIDPHSNNIRILVNRAAVKHMEEIHEGR
jgi:hypothetical protein